MIVSDVVYCTSCGAQITLRFDDAVDLQIFPCPNCKQRVKVLMSGTIVHKEEPVAPVSLHDTLHVGINVEES